MIAPNYTDQPPSRSIGDSAGNGGLDIVSVHHFRVSGATSTPRGTLIRRFFEETVSPLVIAPTVNVQALTTNSTPYR